MSAIIMSNSIESVFRLEHVSDVDLLTSTRQLIGRSNQLLAALLAHLAEEANHLELLARAKYRTKREVLRLVRCLSPEPDIPDRVEPLGPGGQGAGSMTLPSAPSWNQFVESYAPSVRELPPGERPKDWVDSADVSAAGVPEPVDAPTSTYVQAAAELPACSVPQRYRVEFTASQEYADLLERARDLLSHAVPSRSLEEVHLRALRLLVEKLERRKYGAPRTDAPTKTEEAHSARIGGDARRKQEPYTRSAPARRSGSAAVVGDARRKQEPYTSTAPARRSGSAAVRRSGSAAVRREVLERDGACCTFVDDTGQRCRETRFLEFHHLHAHGLGGEPSTENLTLRCHAHNELAAEQDFGRAFIQWQKETTRNAPPKQ